MISPAMFALNQAGFAAPQVAHSTGFAPPPGAHSKQQTGFVSPHAFAAAQGLPQPTTAKRPREEGGGSYTSLEQLQNEVKNLQRKEPNAKEQWISWCDQYGEGKRDPSRHGEEFLQTFLSSYKTGMRLPAEAESSGVDKVTKMMQKRSKPFKDVWASYCQVNGGGKSDPAKHPAQYHMAFYDWMAGVVFEVMSAVCSGQDISQQFSESSPLVKRLRTMAVPSGSGGGGVAALPSMAAVAGVPSVAKEALVNQIKAYQRMGEEQKMAWHKYCDTQLGGIRDPARHDTNALLQFAISIVDEGSGQTSEVAEGDPAPGSGGTASARWKRHTATAPVGAGDGRPVIDIDTGTY